MEGEGRTVNRISKANHYMDLWRTWKIGHLNAPRWVVHNAILAQPFAGIEKELGSYIREQLWN